MQKRILGALTFGLLSLGSLTQSQANTICVSQNVAANCTIGIAQLSLTVADLGSSMVRLTIANAGADFNSAEAVYFDDNNNLLDESTVVLSSVSVNGVSFVAGNSAANLPAGNNATPAFDSNFNFQATPPPAQDGVNPGESLSLTFSNANFAAIQADLADGDLRVGVHLISIGVNNQSESFILMPGDGGGGGGGGGQVPEPSTLLLLGSGLAAVVAWGRKRGYCKR